MDQDIGGYVGISCNRQYKSMNEGKQIEPWVLVNGARKTSPTLISRHRAAWLFDMDYHELSSLVRDGHVPRSYKIAVVGRLIISGRAG